MIALRATVEAAPGEIAALSAMPRWGQSETQASQSIATNGQPVSLVISSRNGFRGNVRFKPITGVGDARVSEVSVRCLVPRR